MARMSIECDFLHDERFFNFIDKTGEHLNFCLGLMIRIWARCYHNKSEFISKNEINRFFSNIDLSDALIECDLAEESDNNNIKIKGIRDRIEYLKTKSFAGKKSAESRLKNHGTSIPAKAQNFPNSHRTPPNTCSVITEQPPNTTEPIPIPIPIPNSKVKLILKDESNIKQETNTVSRLTSKRVPTDGSLIWEVYKFAYSQKYKIEPIRNARANSQCSQLIKRLGKENAEKVVKYFLNYDSEYYKARLHVLECCVRDAEKLHAEMSLGRNKNYKLLGDTL